MNEAAVMLIIKEGLILGIARRDDATKFGLPGGKLDPNEAPEKAAKRETLEETSLIINECLLIYKQLEPAVKPGGLDFFTHCYYATDWTGEPQDSEEGKVKWLTENQLTNEVGAFPLYNKEVIKIIKQMYPNIYLK